MTAETMTHVEARSDADTSPISDWHGKWNVWFAWHPVRTLAGKWKWMSRVWRRTYYPVYHDGSIFCEQYCAFKGSDDHH